MDAAVGVQVKVNGVAVAVAESFSMQLFPSWVLGYVDSLLTVQAVKASQRENSWARRLCLHDSTLSFCGVPPLRGEKRRTYEPCHCPCTVKAAEEAAEAAEAAKFASARPVPAPSLPSAYARPVVTFASPRPMPRMPEPAPAPTCASARPMPAPSLPFAYARPVATFAAASAPPMSRMQPMRARVVLSDTQLAEIADGVVSFMTSQGLVVVHVDALGSIYEAEPDAYVSAAATHTALFSFDPRRRVITLRQ